MQKNERVFCPIGCCSSGAGLRPAFQKVVQESLQRQKGWKYSMDHELNPGQGPTQLLEMCTATPVTIALPSCIPSLSYHHTTGENDVDIHQISFFLPTKMSTLFSRQHHLLPGQIPTGQISTQKFRLGQLLSQRDISLNLTAKRANCLTINKTFLWLLLTYLWRTRGK
jgi:hypothetical protein